VGARSLHQLVLCNTISRKSLHLRRSRSLSIVIISMTGILSQWVYLQCQNGNFRVVIYNIARGDGELKTGLSSYDRQSVKIITHLLDTSTGLINRFYDNFLLLLFDNLKVRYSFLGNKFHWLNKLVPIWCRGFVFKKKNSPGFLHQ